MSITLMTAVWRIESLSSTQKLVLLSLADNANDQGECYPSIPQISRRTCLSDRSVRSTIRSLEAAGFIRSAARSGTSTVYFLDLSTPEGRSAPECSSARKDVPPTPEGRSAPPRKDVPPTPERGSPKPSLNRQLNRHLTVIDEGAHEPRSGPPKKKGTRRCPESFEVTDDMKTWARAETPGVDVGFETAAMRDHEFSTARLDWAATWRNWMRTAYRRKPPARASPAATRQDRISATVAALTGRDRAPEPEIIDVVATERPSVR